MVGPSPMNPMEVPRIVRVAVTQHEPEWLNLPKSVEKTCRLIVEAAATGAELVTFPECWIPGYPAWIWTRALDPEMTTKYIRNSLKVESAEMDTICATAAAHKITISLGFSENDGNSLYISQATISGEDGKIKMLRRKLKATHLERTVFGDASGHSLNNVVDLSIGRVGALACWEHIQPLLKYHTFLQREEIHVSAWPPLNDHPGGHALWGMSRHGCHSLSQVYAVESSSFVLHTGALITQKGIDLMKTASGALFTTAGGGSSAIFGPDGRRLTKDLKEDEEGLIVADLNLDLILASRSFVDSCGHYSRPDLLWLGVDNREKKHLRYNDQSASEEENSRIVKRQ